MITLSSALAVLKSLILINKKDSYDCDEKIMMTFFVALAVPNS